MAGGRGGRQRGGASHSSRSSRASLSSSQDELVGTNLENEEVEVEVAEECSPQQQQPTLDPNGLW